MSPKFNYKTVNKTLGRQDLTDDSGLEVDEERPGDVLAGPVLGVEGVEGAVVLDAEGLVRGHLAVGHDPVLQAEQLPARIADLRSVCVSQV